MKKQRQRDMNIKRIGTTATERLEADLKAKAGIRGASICDENLGSSERAVDGAGLDWRDLLVDNREHALPAAWDLKLGRQ